MTQASENTPKKKSRWRRWTLFGLPLAGAVVVFVGGIVFWGGFNTAMEATNTMTFCTSCHEMRDTVYAEYRTTVHSQNRSGVRATCSDCHVPDPWIHKMVRKVEATNELYHKVMGTIDTPEKFEARRLRLATKVWNAMKTTDSRECRNCHNYESMAPENQRPRARQQHMNAMEIGQTCIDCHKGIAHKNVRDKLADEDLEALEKPDPAHVREVTPAYRDRVVAVAAAEAEQAAKAAAEVRAADDAVAARIAAAVEAARADEREKLAAATKPDSGDASAAATDTVAPGIDWNAVTAKPVTLFYPGQASFEWVQNGRQHGGARPFTKGGDRCATCHGNELPAVGGKMVTGTKAEETPIPGKRATIDVALQAAHDGENLYLRLQWQNGPHNPAPFVEGGKMDPDNPIKFAMMISGTGIDMIDQAGCWATCHHDARYMPDAPDADALAVAGDVVGRLDIQGWVSKYIPESRTKIEIRGRRGKKLGGWDKLAAEEEIAQFLEAGTFMDLLRVAADGSASDGYVLARRVDGDGGQLSAQATLDGETWTVVLSRPLVSGAPGDVAIEPGKTYTVGFAIHDDFTVARFHHVSLELSFALDDAAAEVNVVKQ